MRKWQWRWQWLLWWLSLLFLNFQTSSHNSADDKNRRNSSEERSRPTSGDEKRTLGLPEGKVKKSMGEGKKRVSSGSSERGSKSPLKRAQEQSPRKRGRPPKDEKVCFISAASGVSDLLLSLAELSSTVCLSSLSGLKRPGLSTALKNPSDQGRDTAWIHRCERGVKVGRRCCIQLDGQGKRTVALGQSAGTGTEGRGFGRKRGRHSRDRGHNPHGA